MPSNTIDNVTGVVTTSGASTETVCEYTLPTDSVALVTVSVTGQNLSTGASVCAEKMAVAKKIGSNDAQIIGSIANIFPVTGDAAIIASVVTIDTSGNNVRARATGVLLNDIEWYASMHIQMRDQN